MSETERKILEANIKLVDDKQMMMKDIDILIRFLKGNKELKESVKEIIRYYTKMNIDKKVKRMK